MKLRKLIKFILRCLPSRLPTGLTAFNGWVAAVVEHSGLPDNASTRRVAAMFILNQHPTVGWVSVNAVANQLVKAAANQVAVQVIKDVDSEAKATSEAN